MSPALRMCVISGNRLPKTWPPHLSSHESVLSVIATALPARGGLCDPPLESGQISGNASTQGQDGRDALGLPKLHR